LLSRWGTPLLFGPGSITVAHTPHEFIEMHELHSAVDSYMRLVRTLLAS
jgi:acetylornithine deacetylase